MQFHPNNLILVGDHKQLPPFSVVRPDKFQEKNHLRSLLERTVDCNLSPHVLTIQYRMHPKICEMVSNLFYSGRLKAAKELYESRVNKKPCLWLNVQGSEIDYKRRGFSNPDEAEIICSLVGEITKQNPKIKSIFVISFYNMQKNLILEKIDNDPFLKKLKEKEVLEVLSIDACQGSEADYVLISTVRTKGFSRFVEDKQRLCVALSRAKEACFIVGDKKNMTRNPKSIWARIASYFQTL
jgi:superfamily I DNA and/or RNA helicase